jgi:MFS family permease
MLGGLILFGVVFALNSSVHSYLVLAYSDADRVSLSVGFYYMANAAGRLLGTLLSGVLYQQAGVTGSLWGAVVLATAAGTVALFLPPVTGPAGLVGRRNRRRLGTSTPWAQSCPLHFLQSCNPAIKKKGGGPGETAPRRESGGEGSGRDIRSLCKDY